MIVDLRETFEHWPDWRPRLGLQNFSSPDYNELYEDVCTEEECLIWDHNRILDDNELDDVQTENFVNAEADGLLLESPYTNQALSEDQLILLPYLVHGYPLRDRNCSMADLLLR